MSIADALTTSLRKLAYNVRTRAFFEALLRGLLNNDELEKAAQDRRRDRTRPQTLPVGTEARKKTK